MAVAQVPPDWLVPDWPAPTQVRALCTTREGGVSVGPWASFNLGRYTGDDPAAVGANWDTLQAVLSAAGPLVRPVYLKQIHGTALQPLVVDTPDGIEADACTTAQTGVACVAMAADCLPVLFTNREGTRVAAAHAGWRGLAAGVLESALEAFRPPALAEQAQKAINSEASGATIHWHDRRLGAQQQHLSAEVGDFVLRRADGLWAYQLAVVVDDAAQGITHVVRGEDLADNTARQIALQTALGLPTPRYLHTPLVLGADGEKLSKQNGAQALDLSDPTQALRAAANHLDLHSGRDAGNVTELLASWIPAWQDRYC